MTLRPVLLITGASVGIGQHVAQHFARCGYDVAGGSRSAERLEETADAVAAHGGRFLPLVADLRSADAATDAVVSVQREFGRLDVLVNNAAAGFTCPAADLTYNGFTTTMDVTFGSTFWFSQAAYEVMREAGGVIVNMASVTGSLPVRNMAVYSAAKAAVISLTRSLAAEWGPSVRVVGVAPGTIETEGMRALLDDGERHRRASALPSGRLGHPGDVASLVEFLVSPEASFITGSTIFIDGGEIATTNLTLA